MKGCSPPSKFYGLSISVLLNGPSSSSIALYQHRFLENNLSPAFAKRVLGVSEWSQIIVGGSNFGEVCAVRLFTVNDPNMFISFLVLSLSSSFQMLSPPHFHGCVSTPFL